MNLIPEKSSLGGPVTPQLVTLTLNPAVDIATSVDRIVPTHKLRCGPERRDPGGGGINVSRVLRRFGEDALTIFPAGGPIGNLLDAMLASENVRRLVIPIAGNTREDVTVVETATGSEYRFVLPGPSLSEIETELCCDLLARRIGPGTFLVASGSLPPGVSEDFYARVSRLCAERGGRFVLDASGAPLRLAIESGVYLLKPSMRELSELAGIPAGDEAGCIRECRRLVADGSVKYVALSLGEKGAVLVGDRLLLRANAPKVTVATTVGAGDSFLGGLVWSLLHGQSEEEALRIAVAAGSAALQTAGTGLCRIEDVMRLKPQVTVRSLAAPALV